MALAAAIRDTAASQEQTDVHPTIHNEDTASGEHQVFVCGAAQPRRPRGCRVALPISELALRMILETAFKAIQGLRTGKCLGALRIVDDLGSLSAIITGKGQDRRTHSVTYRRL